MVGGEIDGPRQVVAAPSLWPDGPQRHQRDLPVHAGDPDTVVAGRADGAGYVRAVPALGTGRCRGRVGIVVDEIPTVHVIDESVQVIIHAVAGKLLLVHPDVRLQIGMVERNAVVHNRDGHGPVAGHPRPGSGSVDGREAPEVFVTRIVGRLAGLVHVDRLGEGDA